MAKKPKEEKVVHVEKKQFTKKCKCELTSEELRQAGEDLTDALLEIDTYESELETFKKEQKAKVQTAEGRVNGLKTRISSRHEYRDVKCEKVKDFDSGTVTITRLDTDEMLSDDEMSEEDRQMGLQLAQPDVLPDEPGSGPVTPSAKDVEEAGQSQEPNTDKAALGTDKPEPTSEPEPSKPTEKKKDRSPDDLIQEAEDIIRKTQRASTSSLQRRMKIGYTKAATLMEVLEERGIIGPPRGSDPREVLVPPYGEESKDD